MRKCRRRSDFRLKLCSPRAHPRSASLRLSVEVQDVFRGRFGLASDRQRCAAVARSRRAAFPMLSSALDHGQWSGSTGRSYLRTADVLTRERSRRIFGRGDVPVVLGVDGRHEGGCSDKLRIFPSRRALFATGPGQFDSTSTAAHLGHYCRYRCCLPSSAAAHGGGGWSKTPAHPRSPTFFLSHDLDSSPLLSPRRKASQDAAEVSSSVLDARFTRRATGLSNGPRVPAHSSTEFAVLGFLHQNIQPPLERVRRPAGDRRSA